MKVCKMRVSVNVVPAAVSIGGLSALCLPLVRPLLWGSC